MKFKTVMKYCSAAGLVLAFILSGCAPVTVSSVPPGAKLYYKDNDKLIGTTPMRVNLIASGKEIVVRKEGFFSKTIVLSPIDPKNIEVKLYKRNRVMLVSNPPGAEVFLDGKRLGRTPYRLDYKKPDRTFELKAPGYAPVSYTIPDDPEGDVIVNLDRGNTVLIQSIPKKAEIYTIEGGHLGTTPLAVPAAEELFLEMRKDGYYTKEFSVDEETVNPFHVELEREPIIIVYSEPAGAIVVHRGVTLGQTPYRQLVKEDMDLEIVNDRYYTEKITIAPDSPRQVKVALKSKPFVLIKSTPENASLYRSGGVELLGTTPVEVLVEKDTAFEMHMKGYDIRPFVLSPESNREVLVPMKKTTVLASKVVTIDSEPSGAKVYRPGGAEFVGETPLDQHVRSERTFELQLKGYETKIVTVAPDSMDKVVFKLVRDESSRNVTVGDPLLNTPSSF
jgi:hypothetical protein